MAHDLDAWPSPASSEEKNRFYDDASSDLWRLAVYEPLHDGWEFANMAGAELLDFVGAQCRLSAADHVLELCSGTGAVCRYLASKFGCRVTGVDVNEAQVRLARRRANELPAQLALLLRFVHADVTGWTPDRTYELVLAIDSLALLPDPRTVFDLAWRALRPGGHFVFAEILAHPSLSARVREQVWEYDGIRPLPAPERTEALLRARGFEAVHLVDLTHVARNCFRAIRIALERQRTTIETMAGTAEYARWVQSADFYHRNFGTGLLGYWRCAARKPPGFP